MNIFVKRMKLEMERKNITAAELSRRTGINKSSISEYLSGKFLPKQTKTFLIATALGVTPAYLMGADSDIEPVPSLSTTDQTLLSDFHKLNSYGQEKALDYIHDLTENAKYTEKESSTSTDTA